MKRAAVLTMISILVFTCASYADVAKQYFPDGKLKSVMRYNKNGRLDGAYKMYWPNGKLKGTGRYKNGKLLGPARQYSMDGALLKK